MNLLGNIKKSNHSNQVYFKSANHSLIHKTLSSRVARSFISSSIVITISSYKDFIYCSQLVSIIRLQF